MDVITAHQNDFTNVVASMGTSVTDKQFNTLRRLNAKTIILALDADVAGKEALLRAEETTRDELAGDRIAVVDRNVVVAYANVPNIEIKVFILPESKDPDDVIKEDDKIWQQLTEDALPIVDYTFNMVTADLDLTTAKDKSLAADKLLPIIADIKDNIRRDHYLQKLHELTGISYNSLEASLSKYLVRYKAREPKEEVGSRVVRSLVSKPREEYCLALLLQHPELKGRGGDFSPEYFENSENREIFITWQQANGVPSLKKKTDISIHDYIDYLINWSLPPNHVEQKYDDCVLRLEREHIRKLITTIGEALDSEVEGKGASADPAKLKERQIELALRLKEIDAKKGQRRSDTRR